VLPATPEELDAEWLTGALGRRHPGVRVSGVEVLRVDEVTNTHVRLRLGYEEAAGAPEYLFIKMAPLDPARRPTIIATGMGEREARFYADLAPQLPLRVPTAHVSVHDEDDGTFVVMLEDLTTTGCTVSDGTTGVPPDAAARALEELAAMHARFEEPARRATEAPWVGPPGPGSDYAVKMLEFALEHHADRLPPAFSEIARLYNADRVSLQEVWRQGPPTIVHGDPHIGNVFDDHGRTGFLDWGMIMVSTPMRDVSYFLTMAMSIDDRRTHEGKLLRHYLEARKSGGASDIDFDQAWLWHRLQAAYTVPASCQVVLFPEGISERRRIFAEAFLARSAAAVEDLESRAALKSIGI
jgi:aminoglycoside phosphotransferase (APT) family kinase protein